MHRSDGGNRPWFFQSDDWMPNNPDDGFYGSLSSSLYTQTLVAYSIGFHSREEAQEAADQWMKKLLLRAVNYKGENDV